MDKSVLLFGGWVSPDTEIDDPNVPGRKALLTEVFLVSAQDCDLFEVPDAVQLVLDLEKTMAARQFPLN